MFDVTVRPATPGDIALLPAMQIAAGGAFRELDMGLVADGEAPTVEALMAAAAAGDLLVAECDARVVGFVRTRPLDGCLHVEQVTVAPIAQGHGIGRMLMVAAEHNASARGFVKMTLTTFRDVPFNGPFYRRLGWHDLDDDRLTAGLRAERAAESAAGFDRWPRVAMTKTLV